MGWSPEQVAFTLGRMPDPVRLSHETIYTALYAIPRGALQARVMTLRRRRRLSRRSRSKGGVGEARSHFVDPIKLIDQRPEEVGLRLVLGHWEWRPDPGPAQPVARRHPGRAHHALCRAGQARRRLGQDLRRRLRQHPQPLRRCHAQEPDLRPGTRDGQHKWLEREADIDVYFAHPHAPWERGINENTNGLLRRFLSKREDLSRFSQQDLDDIALLMNARIRKSLGKKAPAELFLPEGAFNFVQLWQNPDSFTKVALGS